MVVQIQMIYIGRPYNKSFVTMISLGFIQLPIRKSVLQGVCQTSEKIDS
jgi:hypothetical protein